MKIILSLIIACISITAYSQSNMELTKSLINKYIEELNLIRGDKSLLKEYRFTNDKSNHFERLRINIALFNDFKQTDFWIAKYLFEQESIWRKSEIDYDNEDVDNLYFSALLVSKYQKPEMVIKFFETKMIDFDHATLHFSKARSEHYLGVNDNSISCSLRSCVNLATCTISTDSARRKISI